MNEELVKDKLDTHERRLNSHSEEIDKLKQDAIEFKTDIKNLCESIKSLNGTLRTFGVVGLTALTGFIIYALEKVIFK
ncbi:chromosome segregation ATPase [Clostridium beijerinckii]|uniref:hemolysin XhlA family protein n=1 Tax=Clostridium beijerinckii TaxID=1520 RepID=UPI0014940D09|nr:hemolysin XhlA family protein [Clostridium beijerinckii]NOW85910.1 chromosome segregation ATPase [Clostridium beijerinckii]